STMAVRCLRQLPLLLRNSVSGAVRPHLQSTLRCTAPVLNGYSPRGVYPIMWSRPLATKKAKGKGQTQARVNINAALVEDIINLEEEDFNKNLTIRTSAGSLDHVIVKTKGGKFPLNQLGQITFRPPQVFIVNMTSSPESTAAAIKALQESGMNLNPEVDGVIIQVPVPKVTREHRESLAKLAKQFTNKAKEFLRRVRGDAIIQVKKAKSSVSEDTIKLIEKQIQQMADDSTIEMEKLLAAKTKELLG
uniref:Ribosome-recycling factor, mitochondrial n=1 Tax=Sphenodon punctatus TaxID=8508 RepID=A0A8D0G5B9_SPHPU